MEFLPVDRGAIEISVPFILNVTWERPSHVHKEIVLCPVSRRAEGKLLSEALISYLTDHIPLRSHLCSVPSVHPGPVHGKSVMMLGYRHHISDTRFFEHCYPFFRAEPLSFEKRNEILVSEILLIPEDLSMMPEFFMGRIIHVTGVPFIPECRNTEYPPVDEYSDFSVHIPCRSPVIAQRSPIILISPAGNDFIYSFQIFHFVHFLILLSFSFMMTAERRLPGQQLSVI